MIQATPNSNDKPRTFSIAETRRIVEDCFRPRPMIYWIDFLATYAAGMFCFQRTRGGHMLVPHQGFTGELSQILYFVASCFLFYRCSMFIHELVHQKNELRGFSLVWNLLCGLPFLMPTFVYYTHIDHHRRAHYGTDHDGEYLPLVHRRPRYLLYYLSWTLFIPIFAVVRFMFLSPIAWISPAARQWIHRHASSMVMDPSYIRPLPAKQVLRTMRLQEFGCFVWCWSIAIVPPVFLNRWPVPFLVHAYLVGVFILLLNSLRTLGSHRWRNIEGEMSFVDQLLDSVNYPDSPWLTAWWAPVGSRFHALHHLLPSMPYHHMPKAHRRLMAQLPEDSPYRKTNSPSLSATLLQLVRESRKARGKSVASMARHRVSGKRGS